MSWRGIPWADLALWLCAAGFGAGALLLGVWGVIDCWRMRRGEDAQRRIRAAGLLAKKRREEERR